MATLFGLARIGKDAELRTVGADSVVNLALAFNYGRKGDDGKRPTQWLEASLWGKLATALAPYLLKGGSVSVTIEDIHMETYQSSKGEGTKLVGRVIGIELAGSAPGQQSAAPAPRQAPQQAPARPQSKPAPNFSDMDSDIPFLYSNIGHSVDSTSDQFARSKQGRNAGTDF